MTTQLRVLILEDRLADAELMLGQLSDAGFDVSWEYVDTEEAYLAALAHVPDVILADFHLPHFDALQALAHLRARGLDVPLIVVTGALDDESAVACLRQGAADYLLKDRLSRLGPAVARALEERRVREEERRQATLAAARTRTLEALYDLTVAAGGLLDPVGLARLIVHRALALLDARSSGLFWWDAATGMLRLLACAPGEGPVVERALKSGEGDVGRAFATRAPVLVTVDTPAGARASIAVPLLVHDRAVGVLAVRGDDAYVFGMEHVQVLALVGAAAGPTLETARLYEALAQEHREKAALLESVDDGIFGADLAGRCTFANRSAAAMLGYSLTDLLGERMHALIHHTHADGVRYSYDECPIHQAFLTHQPTRCDEDVFWRRDGTMFPVEYAVSPILDGPDVLGGVVSFRDITARKAAAAVLQETNRCLETALAELQTAQAQLVRQERLHALGQMASGIAHDINNALAPIVGFSELLLTRPEMVADPETLRQQLGFIHTGAQDAVEIIKRLRAFYRQREAADAFEPVSLDSIAAQAIGLAQPRWKDQALAEGRTIEVRSDLQPVPQVVGNAAELREALINLLFNAVDALPAGGTITVRTAAEDSKAVLAVSDTGLGMTEEVRQRCLEPFFTTKGERGTGLGLATVFGVVERHRGTVNIISAPGRGTTVEMRLPLVPAMPVVLPAAATWVPPRALHILVVDDEARVRDVLKTYLQLDGHRVETACDGAEGLACVRANGFDLVITDLAMPKLSGDGLAASIAAEAPTVPVILLTGFGDTLGTPYQAPHGVDVVLGKPFTRVALQEAISTVLARHAAPGAPAAPAGPLEAAP